MHRPPVCAESFCESGTELVEEVRGIHDRTLAGEGLDLGRALPAGASGDHDDLAGDAAGSGDLLGRDRHTAGQTGGATNTPRSGSLKDSRAMISLIGSAVPHWSWVIGSPMS